MSLIPELLVGDLDQSLAFWCGLLGFEKSYERKAEKFAFLKAGAANVMLEELGGSPRQWQTADLQKPYGRGINLQIELSKLEAPLANLAKANWPLYMQPEEKWYRTGAVEHGQKQFLVQDPDGYLLRLCETLGKRVIQ